jgi:hypothetical protein
MRYSESKIVWIIMSKDRKFIAKGIPRSRYLMSVDDPTEMRLLTYSSKGRAEAGFKSSGFYSQYKLPGYKYGEPLATWLEAVPIKMTLEEI